MNSNLIGSIILHYRKEKKLSQTSLSDGICSREHLGRIERGENIPSFETVELLSDRLGINLFSSFSEVYKHFSLDVHLKFLELNNAIINQNYDQIQFLLDQYVSYEEFQIGEPHQLIVYSKGLILSHSNRHEDATELYYNAIIEKYPDIFNWSSYIGVKFTKLDFTIILAYAISLARINKLNSATRILWPLFDSVRTLYISEKYESLANRNFWLNIQCNILYSLFFIVDVDSSILLLDEISNLIILQKKSGHFHMLPELMLCKVSLLKHLDYPQSEIDLLTDQAQCLGLFLYQTDRFNTIKNSILSRY